MADSPPRLWHALRTEAVKRALAAPVRARTPHFVLHCVTFEGARALVPDLPTDGAPRQVGTVDNGEKVASTGLGLVVPKRWARRAVTRNVIRREMREAARRHQHRIAVGSWILLRQRAAMERSRFASAASAALRGAVRAELDLLFAQLPDAPR